MYNSVFGKIIDIVRKHKDIKLVRANKIRSYLVSEPNYYTTKWFSENLLAIEEKKTTVKINKLVCLDISILEITLFVLINTGQIIAGLMFANFL